MTTIIIHDLTEKRGYLIAAGYHHSLHFLFHCTFTPSAKTLNSQFEQQPVYVQCTYCIASYSTK